MDVTTTAMSGLDGLRWKEQMLSGKTSKAEQVDQLARAFEGIMLRQYLDEAMKPLDPNAGFFGAKGSPMYDQIVKDALTSSFSQKGALGLSSALQAQLFPNLDKAEQGSKLQ